jgi:hypothetical protein
LLETITYPKDLKRRKKMIRIPKRDEAAMEKKFKKEVKNEKLS